MLPLSRPFGRLVPLPPSPKDGLTFVRMPKLDPRKKDIFPRQPWDILAHSYGPKRKLRRQSIPNPNDYFSDECAIDSDEPFTRPISRMSTPDLIASCLTAIWSRRRAACGRIRREPRAVGEQHEHTRHEIYYVEGCIVCYHSEYRDRMHAARPYKFVTAQKYTNKILGVNPSRPMTIPVYLRGRISNSGGKKAAKLRKAKADIRAMCEQALCDLDGITPAERRRRALAAAFPPGFTRPPRATRYLR